MDSKELNYLLVKSFPNLIKKYQEEISWQEGDETGSHIVYGDVFTPYLIACIEQNNEAEVKRILEFLENILKLNYKYSNEVVAFSVLERVEFMYKDCAILNKNYGERSTKIIEEIRSFHRR